MEDIQKLVEQISIYNDDQNHAYVEKYTKFWVFDQIQDAENLKKFEKKLKEIDNKNGVDVVDFIKIFLTTIDHTQKETFYICMGLIDFFRDICNTYDLINMIKPEDFANYIVESLLQKDSNTHAIITKKIPNTRKFINNETARGKIRDIDFNAPIILGDTHGNIKRLIKSRIMTDNCHHNNNTIKRAVFGDEIKKIFSIDSLADNISIYNLNCQLEKKIVPKCTYNRNDVIILDFDWSNKQLRIGACLKDYMLIFWDSNDNFEFEKSFSTSSISTEYQTNIWYIEFLNKWFTTDKTYCLNCWDLEQESKTDTYTFTPIKKDIINIIPMEMLKVLAIASMDKIVIIWDPYRHQILTKFDLSGGGGIHSLAYSSTYQLLITAGYDNTINLWDIHPLYFDSSLKGKLIGHQSMITAIQAIEKTPMIISIDNYGKIKIWDIRNMYCIQTVELGIRSTITKLIDLYVYGKLCFIGSRVNFIDFDDNFNIQSTLHYEEQLWPINVDYNFLLNELIICTRKDIRFIDGKTGRTKRIYIGLLKNEKDDIVTCKIISQNQKFILCDQRGKMSLHNYNTGEYIKDLIPHTNEISTLRMDYTNKLIISSSWDSSLYIQKEEKNEFKIKRKITNLHYNKEVLLMEISVYHSLIVTCSSNNIIYLWDYEYIKLIASIQIDLESEPTCIQFINGYAILIIACNQGKLHFLHFKRKDISYISINQLAIIDLNMPKNKDEPISPCSNFDTKESNDSKHELKAKSGSNIGNELEEKIINRRQNSNDIAKTSRRGAILRDHGRFSVSKGHNKELQGIQDLIEDYKNLKQEYKAVECATKLLLDITYQPNNDSHSMIPMINANESRLYVGLSKGLLQCYDISKLLKMEQLEIIPHANCRTNYNASRTVHENFETLIKNLKIYNYDINNPEDSSSMEYHKFPKKPLNLLRELLYEFQAHKDSFTTLCYILCPDKKILTSSIDSHIKIWDLDGSLIGSININHPLPLIWNLKFNKKSILKKRIIYAFQMMDLLNKRYENTLSVIEEKQINATIFLNEMYNKINNNTISPVNSLINIRKNKLNDTKFDISLESSLKNQNIITEINEDNKKRKLLLMKDEYSPRDLQYDISKKIFQKEIQGPTLKQMEITKRLSNAQKDWKKSEQIHQQEEQNLQLRNTKIKDACNKAATDVMSYIYSDIFNQTLYTNEKIYSSRTKDLAKKLDICTNHHKSKESIYNFDKKTKNEQNLRKSINLHAVKENPLNKFPMINDRISPDRLDVTIQSEDSEDRSSLKNSPKKKGKSSNNQSRETNISSNPIKKSGTINYDKTKTMLLSNRSIVPSPISQIMNSMEISLKTDISPNVPVRSSLSKLNAKTECNSHRAIKSKTVDFISYASQKLPEINNILAKTSLKDRLNSKDRVDSKDNPDSVKDKDNPDSAKDKLSMQSLNLQYLLKTQHQKFQQILNNLEQTKKKSNRKVSSISMPILDDHLTKTKRNFNMKSSMNMVNAPFIEEMSKEDEDALEMVKMSRIRLDNQINNIITQNEIIRKYKKDIHEFIKNIEKQNQEIKDEDDGKMKGVQQKLNEKLERHRKKNYDGDLDGDFQPLSNIFSRFSSKFINQ